MRVLHVIPRYAPAIGGAERWCAGVCRDLVARGHQVSVLTLRVVDEDDIWSDVAPPVREVTVGPIDRDGDVHVERCALSHTPWGLLRLVERIGLRIEPPYSSELFGRTMAAVHETDVVHVHQCTQAPSFWGVVAARLARRPVVITPHFHSGDPTFEQPAVGWLLRRAGAVIADTSWEAQALAARGVAPGRLITATVAADIPPLDPGTVATLRERLRARWGLGPETRIAVFIGRKSRNKALAVLAEAAVQLARDIDLTLVLVGPSSGWYAEQLPLWRARGARIIDVPAVPESAKHAAIAAADALVQPSIREAFGIVFLEAWAMGRPVVGAAMGAVPGVIGDAGLTFTPDDPTDLAAKLRWLLAHPDEGHAMAARGATRLARDHTWAKVGAAVEQAYAVAMHPNR
jgi:glycosyltransferase involved in cell wall biosynthesis